MPGFGSERQILEALRRYLARPQYIQKTLYYLFKMTTGNYEPRIDMAVPRYITILIIIFILVITKIIILVIVAMLTLPPRVDIIWRVLSCAKEYPTVFPIQVTRGMCSCNAL